MRTAFFLLVLLLAGVGESFAHHHHCSHDRRGRAGAQKTAQQSPLENDYEVKHVWLNLNMSNTATTLSGAATTTGVVANPSGMSTYAFELDAVLTIDSVVFNGQSLSPTRAGNLVTVALNAPVPFGQSFSCRVVYHGTPPAGSGLFSDGVNQATSPLGTKIIYTISDQFLAKDWWPSKQSLTDKIDSADLWFTVPTGLKAGSNGLLKNVTPLSGHNRFEWKTRYPIDYYLIAVAIAPYAEHHATIHYSGSSDTTPILSYVYDSAALMPLYQQSLDSMPLIAAYLSELYGRYPFWQEKYGHCIAPLGGGMEHQTMTFVGLSNGAIDLSTLAHELGHQWWGDHVTYSRWRDVWLSEGFATYTEQLYREGFWSMAAAKSWRTGQYNQVMGAVGGTLLVPDADTTNPFRVFDYRLTYAKGASVAHMLRYQINNDSVYFAALRAFQQQYAFGVAGTAEFKTSVEGVCGFNLDTFFNQWVYGEGYPKFGGQWNQVGSQVIIRLTQSASKPGVTPLFSTPLDIRLSSASGDTTIRIYTNAAEQLYSFSWSKTMTGFTVDPDDHILNRTTAITQDQSLGIHAPWADGLRVSPNPARDSWQVSNASTPLRLYLLNASGQLLHEVALQPTQTATIPAADLPVGLYFLKMVNKAGDLVVRKLQKQGQ